MLESYTHLQELAGCDHATIMYWQQVLANKKVAIDPGHGASENTDLFRRGPTAEREEDINLRVAHYLSSFLKILGVNVILTRTANFEVGLAERAQIAVDAKCEVFISIHHNAAYPHDANFNYPCIFFHSSNTNASASFSLAESLARQFSKMRLQPTLVVSDQFIFENGFGVLRELHKQFIPAVIGEFSFFSNPEEETRLKNPRYVQQEALAYLQSLVGYFENSKGHQNNIQLVVEQTTPYFWLQEKKKNIRSSIQK